MPKALTLEQKISNARCELQEAYDARGYTDSTVLAAGTRLDKLINRYQKKLLANAVPGLNHKQSG
jgi:hypothetical protein